VICSGSNSWEEDDDEQLFIGVVVPKIRFFNDLNIVGGDVGVGVVFDNREKDLICVGGDDYSDKCCNCRCFKI
jgi:hypothetical protein